MSGTEGGGHPHLAACLGGVREKTGADRWFLARDG
jgi:hypothetical protein